MLLTMALTFNQYLVTMTHHFGKQGASKMNHKISSDSLSAAMAAFQAKGGKIQSCNEGARSIDPSLRSCGCGCGGNWTDHTMRLGENGERARWG